MDAGSELQDRAHLGAKTEMLKIADNRLVALRSSDESPEPSCARLPPCDGKVLAEGFTYLFRSPHRGEIVMFRARGSIGGEIVPTAHDWNLQINKRVIAIPGDTVEGRRGRVFVNGDPADNIPTVAFAAVHLGRGQYFVMGDNRSASEDSRAFGPVPRKAIYARVVLDVWPIGRFGVPRYDKNEKPPGPLCGQS